MQKGQKIYLYLLPSCYLQSQQLSLPKASLPFNSPTLHCIIPTSIILTSFAFIVLSPFSLFFHLQCLQPRTDQLTVHLRIRRIVKKLLFCHLYFLLKLFRQIQHKSPAFCLHHSSLPPAIDSLIRCFCGYFQFYQYFLVAVNDIFAL